jgi:hypothetical protein
LQPGGGWVAWALVPDRPGRRAVGGPRRVMSDVESVSLAEEKMQCATRSAYGEAPLQGWGAVRHLCGVQWARRGTGDWRSDIRAVGVHRGRVLRHAPAAGVLAAGAPTQGRLRAVLSSRHLTHPSYHANNQIHLPKGTHLIPRKESHSPDNASRSI